MKRHIAAICGGFSSEKEISMKSVSTIMDHLDTALFVPHKVVIDEAGWNCHTDGGVYPVNKNDFSYEGPGGKINLDYAFIMIHGTPGEDGLLQGYLDMMGIPYSTCNHDMSTLTFNKWACNHFLKGFGIPCADSILVRRDADYDSSEIAETLGFPMFVKPNDGGSSFGISKVKSESEIAPAIEKARSEGTDVIIEAFMEGPEMTCGAYKGKEGIVVLPITEILSDNDFFDYEAKYKGESNEITPAQIDDDLKINIQEVTTRVYDLMGLAGFIRIDYIIRDGIPHLIEVNTVPGFSPQSIVPQQVSISGRNLTSILTEIIELS